MNMLEFNNTEGEIGIYKRHIPTTVIVKPGLLYIHKDEEDKVAALHSGFAEILQDKVTILAEIIEWPDEIDMERAEAAKQRAENRLNESNPDIDEARARAALARALTRISARQ